MPHGTIEGAGIDGHVVLGRPLSVISRNELADRWVERRPVRLHKFPGHLDACLTVGDCVQPAC